MSGQSLIRAYSLRMWVLVGTVLFLSSCKTNKAQQVQEKAVVIIEKTACLGRCPVYKAVFYDSNRMVFTGIRNVPLTGTYSYTVPDKMLVNIINDARAKRYTKFSSKYAEAVDFPSTITTITVDGVTKKVETQANAPDDLRKLQDKIHDEVMAIIAEQKGTPVDEVKDPEAK